MRFDSEENQGGLLASVGVGGVQGGGREREMREEVEGGARGTDFGRVVVGG